MRILIAEDDPGTRHILATTLNKFGSIVIADDGEQAMVKFHTALAGDEPFDLVVLDLEMPRLDGLTVLESIRATEGQMGIVGDLAVKSIILTGHDETGSLYEAMRMNCNAYLLKPVDTTRLIAEARRLGALPASKSEIN